MKPIISQVYFPPRWNVKQSDLRVRRTRKLLHEALIALIEERGFDAADSESRNDEAGLVDGRAFCDEWKPS